MAKEVEMSSPAVAQGQTGRSPTSSPPTTRFINEGLAGDIQGIAGVVGDRSAGHDDRTEREGVVTMS